MASPQFGFSSSIICKTSSFEQHHYKDNKSDNNKSDDVELLCRGLFAIKGSAAFAERVPIGMLCIVSPKSREEEKVVTHDVPRLLDHIASQVIGGVGITVINMKIE